MAKEITTQDLQTKFIDIINTYHEYVNNFNLGENNAILKLILAKTLTNLCSANLLWSKALFYDSFILLRSSFESFILFEYLVSFPDEVDTYKLDSEISEFKNLYGYYKRGLLSIEQLSEVFLELQDETKAKLKINIDPKTNLIEFNLKKLEGFFKSHKSILQNPFKMMDKLKEAKHPYIKEIDCYSLHTWNINSQMVHGEFHHLKNYFIKTEFNENEYQSELLDKIKECFRQSSAIIVYSMESINSLIEDSKDFKISVWEKIKLFHKYLGYDVSRLFNQKIIEQSDLIQIIKNPILIPVYNPTQKYK
ncbi:MAG: hypothetical protein ACD_20C00003G0019 [uncultured bacterium]|nr:MAG: hypothetical protein ACD_20C00003G0019 [uncultured bacterium]HBH19078.1 hypothetical protein [Cyanobacteria bacterium UBA9579]